jgi:hypothetical protein
MPHAPRLIEPSRRPAPLSTCAAVAFAEIPGGRSRSWMEKKSRKRGGGVRDWTSDGVCGVDWRVLRASRGPRQTPQGSKGLGRLAGGILSPVHRASRETPWRRGGGGARTVQGVRGIKKRTKSSRSSSHQICTAAKPVESGGPCDEDAFQQPDGQGRRVTTGSRGSRRRQVDCLESWAGVPGIRASKRRPDAAASGVRVDAWQPKAAQGHRRPVAGCLVKPVGTRRSLPSNSHPRTGTSEGQGRAEERSGGRATAGGQATERLRAADPPRNKTGHQPAGVCRDSAQPLGQADAWLASEASP